MSTIPYLSQGIGVRNLDPRTGLPRRRRPGAAQTRQYPGFDPRTGIGAPDPGTTPIGVGGGGGAGGGPPGSIRTPGFTPDYKSLIEAALGPLRAQLGAEGVSDAASRNAALSRALVGFGEPLDLAGAQARFGKDFIDQASLEQLLATANPLAQKNTEAGLSFMAQATRARDREIGGITNSLGARGLINSGALGIELNRAQQGFDQGQQEARLGQTDYVNEVLQGYQAGERARQQALLTAERDEAVRQATLNPATGTWTAPFSGRHAPDGRPLYVDRNGELVYPDGTKYVEPAVAAPPPGAPPPAAPPVTATPPAEVSTETPVDWQDILARALRAGQTNRAV